MGEWVLGVLGGSGLDAMEGFEDVRREEVETPWGRPSDALTVGRIGSVRVVFLPRHGRGHRRNPSEVNYRANIAALKMAGCTDVLSLSAVGSLREELAPGAFVVVDQFIDRTFTRPKTFFEGGVVAHVSLAQPTCPRLAGLAAQSARTTGAPVTEGGTYLCMEGPQFSTRAESDLYRAWGCHVIGMTNAPEAKLAREAELPFASVCMVTDYDCWRDEGESVEVEHILAVMHDNASKARALVRDLAGRLTGERPASPIDRTLDAAVVTPPASRDPEAVSKLRAVAGRVLGDA